MGGWFFADAWLELTLKSLGLKMQRPRYAGRPATASTAAGLMSKHVKELETLLEEALG
jgi:2-oxoglutarate dehydrogenase E1 component